jgi:hypothetical protein
VRENGIETANSHTVAARSACLLIDNGNLSTFEILLFLGAGLEHQLQIGGVYIGVCQNNQVSIAAVECEMGEGRRDAGFSGATFAAKNHELLH